MKKLFTILLIISFLFTSCYYIADYDYFTFQEKNTYSSFENLNDPLILSMPFTCYFRLYGNPKNYREERSAGSLALIYDWENKTLVDYVYIPGKYGLDNNSLSLPGIKDSFGNYKFYAIEKYTEKMYVMRSNKTELEMISLNPDSSVHKFIGQSGIYTEDDRLLVKRTSNYNPKENNYTYYYNYIDFSNDTLKEIGETKDREISDTIYTSSDTYWTLENDYSVKEDNHNTYVVSKHDVKDSSVNEKVLVLKTGSGEYSDNGFENKWMYYLLYANSDYLYLTKKGYKGNVNDAIVEIDLKNNCSIKEYEFPDLSEDSYLINRTNVLNGKLYLCQVDAKNTNISISSFDLTNHALTLSECLYDYKDDYKYKYCFSGNPVVRGNNLYFINNNTNEIQLVAYDTVNKQIIETKEFTLDSLKEFN